MENTLKIRDRIFVNKLVYGPELIPGMFKISGLATPARNAVIIFESPTYISKGPVFDILQRVLYMVTLSLVDIDRDENGEPRAHFLIKRAIGMSGDRIRIRRGEVLIRPPGADDWVAEKELDLHLPVDFTTRRMITQTEYLPIEAAVRSSTYEREGITPLVSDTQILDRAITVRNDSYQRTAEYNKTMHQIHPQRTRYRSEFRKYAEGWYIPERAIFPMGDNRDNSNDARYFGPVYLDDVLGKGMFIYWPLARMTKIR